MDAAIAGPQAGVVNEVSALYGDDFFATPSDVATPMPTAVVDNPHDKADKGPSNFLEDPIVWLTAAFAIGAGIIGFRFHWGPGAKVSGSVDVTDEWADTIGHVFLAIAGIAAFKLFVAALKDRAPKALQEFAAFI